MIDFLRIANVILWSGVMLYMLPGAWAAVTGKGARFGDVAHLALFWLAFMVTAFRLRSLYGIENEMAWSALYILGIVVAIYVVMVARAYGRGGKL